MAIKKTTGAKAGGVPANFGPKGKTPTAQPAAKPARKR
jgi:hypothetical protein